MANQITLTFAGEPSDLSSAFQSVGQDADRMAERTAQATERMAERFDYASSQASMLSGGIGDVGGSLTAAFGEESAIGEFGAEMERYGTIVMGVVGISDLLLFATNNLRLAQLKAAFATKAQAAAQWVMNAAMWASPITWIVAGILLLIGAIVLIATKTDWFQRAWRASWGWIKSAAANTWEFIKKIPGWIGTAFMKVNDLIARPFRAAFNAVARGWNSTVGRLSWTVPAWVPIIGGNSISVPKLPTLHSGGIVPGIRGTAVPIMALAGERVNSLASSGGSTTVAAGDPLTAMIFRIVKEQVQAAGGDPSSIGLQL